MTDIYISNTKLALRKFQNLVNIFNIQNITLVVKKKQNNEVDVQP